MVYLEKFSFPSLDENVIDHRNGSYFDDVYPFHINDQMGLYAIDFEPITIVCGSNGSGKSTILNVIAQKLCADRLSMFNSSHYFKEFVDRCDYISSKNLAGETMYNGYRAPQKYDISKITTVLTSDDIFHLMQERRLSNDMKLHKSEFLQLDYSCPEPLPRHLNFETGCNVDRYQRGAKVRGARNFSQYLTQTLGRLERGFSNGETALMKLSEVLETPGIYILDEPENSMSCEFQLKLKNLIEYLARQGKCQFIISTHSPFLLSLFGAKIYNLDTMPVGVCRWWEVDSMRHYFNLFESERDKFMSDNRN